MNWQLDDPVQVEIYETVRNLLHLWKSEQWRGAEMVRELKGPRGMHRFRYRLPRTTLMELQDAAAHMLEMPQQLTADGYKPSVTRALKSFIKAADQALKGEPHV